MKPLMDMTAKNDDVVETRELATVERARKRSHRERHLKGPMWAQSPRETEAAKPSRPPHLPTAPRRRSAASLHSKRILLRHGAKIDRKRKRSPGLQRRNV